MKVDFNPPRTKDSRNLPIGSTLVGRVSEDDDASPGALVRLSTGIYVRMNDGHRGSLDQSLVNDAIERAKDGTGGTFAASAQTRQCNMQLTEDAIQTLRIYGAGNVTHGVRKAVDLIRLCGVAS